MGEFHLLNWSGKPLLQNLFLKNQALPKGENEEDTHGEGKGIQAIRNGKYAKGSMEKTC